MIWCLLASLLAWPSAAAQQEPTYDPKVSWEGRLSAGGAVTEFKNGESFYDMQIELASKRRQGHRAKLVLAGENDEPGVWIKEAFIDHKFANGEKLLFGQAKKRLGREYEDSHRERLTVKRSPLYRKLEEFAFVGHELSLRYFQDEAWSISAGYSESIDADVILSLQGNGYGTWLLAQSDRIDQGRQVVYAIMTSAWYRDGRLRAEAELAYGKDPFASEFEKAFGSGDSVHFAAFKAQSGYSIGLNHGDSLEPVVQSTYILHDDRTPKWTTLQLLIGLNYLIDKVLRISLDIEGLGSNSKLDLKRRAYDESNMHLEATYYF